MNKFLLLILGVLFSIGLRAQTDLFFSEYVEGSGNNKALEIYNPTTQSIDLAKYYVARFSNGKTDYSDGGIIQLTGTLEPYKTYVLVNGQTTSTSSSPAPDPTLQAMADQLDNPYPAATYMNGNDAIALLKSETGSAADALPVDLFGKIGQGSKISGALGWAPYNDTTITYTIGDVEYQHTISDYIIRKSDDTNSAAYGPYWLAWSADHTLRRKFDIVDGVKENPDEFDISLQWDTVSVAAEGVDQVTGETYTFRRYEDIWDNLGKHLCIADPNAGNSVQKFEDNAISIFPTLIEKQSFTIRSSADLINSIVLFNLNGGVVYRQTFHPNNEIVVQLPDLSRGLYIVKTTTVKQTQRTLRIVIQ